MVDASSRCRKRTIIGFFRWHFYRRHSKAVYYRRVVTAWSECGTRAVSRMLERFMLTRWRSIVWRRIALWYLLDQSKLEFEKVGWFGWLLETISMIEKFSHFSDSTVGIWKPRQDLLPSLLSSTSTTWKFHCRFVFYRFAYQFSERSTSLGVSLTRFHSLSSMPFDAIFVMQYSFLIDNVSLEIRMAFHMYDKQIVYWASISIFCIRRDQCEVYIIAIMITLVPRISISGLMSGLCKLVWVTEYWVFGLWFFCDW